MADSIREQCVAAFATRLGAVRYGRDVPLALFDGDPETAEDPNPRYRIVRSTIVARVEYTESIDVTALATWSQTANAKLAELIATATGTDLTLGGVAETIRYTGAEFGAREGGGLQLGLNITFEIQYAFQAGDPYTTGDI